MAVEIPLISPSYPAPERETPVTARENLLLALDHKKPYWMPNIYADSQMVISKFNRDMPASKNMDGYDWFGTHYVYSETVGINVPTPGVFDEISQWRDKVKWPDLDAIDWQRELDGFVRDENKALYMRMGNGPFERLHAFEGFEQALVDMLTEPEETCAFFERLVDYKIDLFSHLRDIFPFDFIVAADDYGTARAPFFSTELFEETLLEPTKRFVKAVQARGTRFIAHCCGKVDDFIPYFANELGVDGLEIQTINDVAAIYENYGDRLTVEYACDPRLVFNTEADDEECVEHVRSIIDTYGAHAVNGGGIVMNLKALNKDRYYKMEQELYSYSSEQYEKFHK